MATVLGDLAENTFLVVGALFPIVNPIGNTPIFLSLTRGLSGQGRATLARMIALNGLALILASIFIGTHILAFFGISLPVVQVGGDLVVISTGWALLRHSDDETDGKERPEGMQRNRLHAPGLLPVDATPDGGTWVDLGRDHGRRQSHRRFGVAVDVDRGDAARLAADRGIDLPELPVCRTDWAHPRGFGDERDHPHLVVHPGLHRRSDPLEWIERFASHPCSVRGAEERGTECRVPADQGSGQPSARVPHRHRRSS